MLINFVALNSLLSRLEKPPTTMAGDGFFLMKKSYATSQRKPVASPPMLLVFLSLIR